MPNKKWGGKNAVDDIDRAVKKVALETELEAIGWDEIKAELKAEQEPGRPITREQVLDKMQKRRLVLKTVTFSGDDLYYSPENIPDYWRHERTTGATKHIEVAVLLDGFEEHPDYRRKHFGGVKAETPGMIGWMRFSVESADRLRLEEMQSDLEQQIASKEIPPEWGSPFGSGRWRTAFFKLAMMRAAELGYKELSWPTGEEIVARNYAGQPETLAGFRYLLEHDPELAEKVTAQGAGRIGWAITEDPPPGTTKEDDLKVAMEWARNDTGRPSARPLYSFVRTYDIILPQIARKLGKKTGIGRPMRVEGPPLLADQKAIVEITDGTNKLEVPVWYSRGTTDENGIDGERQYVTFLAPQARTRRARFVLVHLAASEDAAEQ